MFPTAQPAPVGDPTPPRPFRRARSRAGIMLATLALFAGPLHAVIFFPPADINHNTTAPTGTLAGSGWQWIGTWGGFQGTVIGPRHFLTARHVGGSVGDNFVFQGATYPTVAFVDDAVSDLRICEVAGTFPTWAPLYRGNDEIGKTLVVFGRGLTRGDEVRVGGNLKGWLWGPSDGRLHWGENQIFNVVIGGSALGPLLYALFEQNAGPNEAHLAVGDSAGPIFVREGSEWKLTGIAYSVDAYFSKVGGADTGFIAAIFDTRGLYYGSQNAWTYIPEGLAGPVASGFYATRVSGRAEWIDSVIAPPPARVPALPPGTFPLLAACFALLPFVINRSRKDPRPDNMPQKKRLPRTSQESR